MSKTSKQYKLFMAEAREAYENEEYETALRLIDQAAELLPGDFAARFARTMTHLAQQNVDAAMTDLNEWIEADPTVAYLYLLRSGTRAMQDDFDAALRDMNEAIRLEPGNDFYYYQRAQLYLDLDDLEMALKDAEEALRLAPEKATHYGLRSDVYYRIRRLDEAISDASRCIELDPQDGFACSWRAELYFERGEYEQALAAFEQANRLRPGAEDVHAGLAITCHALGRVEQAQKMWRLLIRAVDEQFADAEWVKEAFGWPDPLMEEVRKLIASLTV